MRRAALVAALLIGLLTAPAKAAPDELEVKETLRRTVEQLVGTGEATVAGRVLSSRTALPAVYEARGFRLLWSDRGNEEALLGEVAAAAGDGLNPADYHFEALRELLERRRRQPDHAGIAAAADLLMTDALMRLAVHVHLGKVDPTSGQPRWDSPELLRGERIGTLLTRIATGSALALQLGELRPVQPMYGRLKSALARYRLMAEEGAWEPLPAGRVLQLGMEDPRVPPLRRRLALTGDFHGVLVDSPRFEPALEQALRRFQARHGLEADGLFGPATLQALNRPVDERKDQLRVNLERARWLLAEVRGLFLLVDPAGRQVVLMDNSQPVVTQAATFSPVALAMPEARGEMRYLVVHPDHVLPPALVDSQVAPLARRDPAQLEARGLQVLDADGKLLSPRQIDWSRPPPVVVRQQPGPRSFLGSVRLPIRGVPALFLHGGPEEGDTLPGVVRLEAPLELARALAVAPADFDRQDLAVAVRDGQPRTFTLGRPLPVLYGPWTVWVELDGSVVFRPGFADRDAEVLAGLRRGSEPG